MYNEEIMCIPSEEVKIGYYYGDNLIYYKCKDNCKTCLNAQNCIKCLDSYAKKDNNNLTCHLIDELRPYYFQDPNDDNNFLKCTDYYECSTCDEIKCIDLNDDNNNKKKDKKIGMIIGIIVGISGPIIIVLILMFCLLKKCQQNKRTIGGDIKIGNKIGQIDNNNNRGLSSSEERIIKENMVNCTFKTTSGNIKKIYFDKNKTMGELIKKYFEEMDIMRYYGRVDLFGFLCNANKITFDSLEFVNNYFSEDGNNFILVRDLNNLIINV